MPWPRCQAITARRSGSRLSSFIHPATVTAPRARSHRLGDAALEVPAPVEAQRLPGHALDDGLVGSSRRSAQSLPLPERSRAIAAAGRSSKRQ
jgi:hypothetical protein